MNIIKIVVVVVLIAFGWLVYAAWDRHIKLEAECKSKGGTLVLNEQGYTECKLPVKEKPKPKPKPKPDSGWTWPWEMF